jgi:hypothetical protein
MRIITFFISFFVFGSVSGQIYNTELIISKADSILRTTVGDSIYKYYQYDKLSCYEYKNSRNKSNLKYLIKNKRTKGRFVDADVRFYFKYPVIKGICILTSVKLDSNLNLIKPIYLKQIPDFLWQGKPCDFISGEKALEIAKDSLKHKGIEPIKQYLDYDSKRERYVYMVFNVLTKQTDTRGHDSGEEELFIIDAITGKILAHWESWYEQLD